MAIGAHGDQVIDGVYHIAFADLIQRNDMVHFNDILKLRTVSLFKTHTADLAGIAMICKADWPLSSWQTEPILSRYRSS